MSTLSSANVTDVNLVLKERTHMRLCLNMLIFTHNLGNWLIGSTCCFSCVCVGDLDTVLLLWILHSFSSSSYYYYTSFPFKLVLIVFLSDSWKQRQLT